MKRIISFFILIFFVLSNLYSQTNNNPVSFKDVPLDLYLQIGFLFVYIVLGLLFLMIYIFYPRQRLNLFFSLFNISLALLILNMAYFKNGVSDFIVEDIISRFVGANILLFLLYALDRMKPFFWWFIAFLLCIDLPLNIIFPDQYSVTTEIVHSLFTLVCFLLAIAAFRNKKPADWLIGLIALAVVFINLRFLLFFFAKIQIGSEAADGIVPFIITISAVLYLALRYGRVNTSLEQQLKQVRVLSELNLRAEKEKQDILADQNISLEHQVTQRTAELNTSLNELKSTQAQLIQSEKMASLGELTAGIAHEIQNPLNFVNNFSEVSSELVDELENERSKVKSERNEEVESGLLIDLKNNLEKINHHGKRADNIVKGMLQHSRTSKGEKTATDINVLAEEYLRLSYQGLRSKDFNFNAIIKTDFDQSIGKINIVPQDIGRVLLNLYNNAFYACTERSRSAATERSRSEANIDFQPTVWVTTKKEVDKVFISVRDNGNGIPQKVIDKIFQPFFTTKPTGQGTGLGLSLSYDIIKAHGGELKVKTEEGEGAEFIILLP